MLPRCIWAKGNYWSISALQSSTYLSRGYENEPAGNVIIFILICSVEAVYISFQNKHHCFSDYNHI